MSISLLPTKLYIPPLRSTLVRRRRLLDRIDHGLTQGHCLTLISAPAGFGKTTLVAEWIHVSGESHRPLDSAPESPRNGLDPNIPHPSAWLQSPAKAAWLSLEAGDNNPARFWRYVIAALQTLDPALGATGLAMLGALQPPPLDSLVTSLLNDLSRACPENPRKGFQAPSLILALDDYHVIQNELVHASVNFLLDHLWPSMHVLISTREDPPLALPRRRARMQLTELRAADLRFTSTETAEFLNTTMGLGLSNDDISTLSNRTEGWAVGLQLAAIALKELASPPTARGSPLQPSTPGPLVPHEFVATFAGDDRYIADYLVEEVLLRQPPHIQTFLLQTSLLSRLNASLCNALLERDDSRSILNALEHANLFIIPLDNRREWYRYHHLFADLLRQRLLQSEGEPRVAGLHRRASEWYEQNGFAYEAIEHALAARDYDNAIRLIEHSAPDLFQHSELHTLLDWICTLPPELVSSRPKLNAIAAWAHRIMMHPPEIETYVQRVEQALGARMEDLLAEAAGTCTLKPEVRNALVEIAVLRVTLALDRTDIPRVFELADCVIPYLETQTNVGLYMYPRELLSLVRYVLGHAHQLRGNVRAAVRSFEASAALAESMPSPHLAVMALGDLADIQVLHGTLHQAAEAYRRTLQVAGDMPGRDSPFIGSPRIGLGLLAYEWNELATAQQYIQTGLDHARLWNNWDAWAKGSLAWARIKQAQGDVSSAQQVLEELPATGQNIGQSILQPLRAARARLWLAQGNLEAVADWAHELGLEPDREIPYWREGQALVLARWLIAQGKLEEAGRLCARLVESSETGERWGQAIERLLVQARALEVQGDHTQALTTVMRTLALAEPEGYIRTFVDEGEILRALIAECRVLLSKGPRELRAEMASRLLSYTTQLLAAFPKSETPPRTQFLIEPLSPRELEVLRLIAAGLSNQEIAERLVISITTCKSHTTSIYSKLQVKGRTQAVATARALGLLRSD